MEDKFVITPKLRKICYFLIIIGIGTIVIGIFQNKEKMWANFLLGNYYFISIAVGATLFLALQYITQSGWSVLFLRIPQSIGMYFRIAFLLIILLVFGMHSLYQWSVPEARDVLIEHKLFYLNTPFFLMRIVLFLALWVILSSLLRSASLKEDTMGGVALLHKTEIYSKIFIFVLAFSFSLFTFDLIMSIDVHWFSTIFAVKNLIAGFYHSVAVIALIIIMLNRKGYLKQLNDSHLHDFSRYIFMLSIIWAYLWFVQYLLIWFANIQEETIYYYSRLQGPWRPLFFLNIILNFFIPFLTLLSPKLDRKKSIISRVCVVLIIGQWVDLYLQIMPGTTGVLSIGYIEIGTFAGFAGLFILWSQGR